jgi:hypothetical protein
VTVVEMQAEDIGILIDGKPGSGRLFRVVYWGPNVCMIQFLDEELDMAINSDAEVEVL